MVFFDGSSFEHHLPQSQNVVFRIQKESAHAKRSSVYRPSGVGRVVSRRDKRHRCIKHDVHAGTISNMEAGCCCYMANR